MVTTTGEGTGPLRETAYAKINLYLHVTGIRDDGYHVLDSLFVFARTGDDLRFSAADNLRLTVDGPFAAGVAVDASNLVVKAAQTLAEEAGIQPRAHIQLIKNLPMASGIGGGSADAAAALRGLNRLWGTELPVERLEQLGATLGADVPACVQSRSVLVAGVGDVFGAYPALPDVWVVLINPGIAVSTPEIFRRFDAAPVLETAAPLGDMPTFPGLVAQLRGRRNSLEVPARDLAPVISDTLQALEGQPDAALCRMSGSGATCFALFSGEAAAIAAAEALCADHPEWWVAVTPLRTGPGASAA